MRDWICSLWLIEFDLQLRPVGRMFSVRGNVLPFGEGQDWRHYLVMAVGGSQLTAPTEQKAIARWTCDEWVLSHKLHISHPIFVLLPQSKGVMFHETRWFILKDPYFFRTHSSRNSFPGARFFFFSLFFSLFFFLGQRGQRAWTWHFNTLFSPK